MNKTFYHILILFFVFITSCKVEEENINESDNQKIISLVPSLTEFASLVCPENIIAIGTHCNGNKWKDTLPRINTWPEIDYESILKLKPDKVFVLKGFTNNSQINKMKNLGLSVVTFSSESVSEVMNVPIKMGEITNTTRGKEVRDSLKLEQEKLIKQKIKEPASFMVFIVSDPIMVYGANNYLSEFYKELGFSNSANAFDAPYPELPKEYFISHIPDIIIGSDTTKIKKSLKRSFEGLITKKQLDHLIFIQANEDELYRAGPNFLKNGNTIIKEWKRKRSQ